MSNKDNNSVVRIPIAGILAWILPGLGHIYLGYRGRGLILLVAITATFWSGVAIGGVSATVNPQQHKMWFLAQLCTGANTLAAYGMTQRVLNALPRTAKPSFPGHWLSTEVGVHYTGVAGLLNILIILDAIARADPSFVRARSKRRNPEGVP